MGDARGRISAYVLPRACAAAQPARRRCLLPQEAPVVLRTLSRENLCFLSGCPGPKKHEFLTSVLDALSTDMVHAVSDPSSSSGR